jgi:hypothetical protein
LCDANIFLELSGGSDPYSYEWNTGQQEKNLIGICAGDYLLMVTDSKNCSDSETFSITEPEEIEFELDTVIDVRIGQPGSIEITVENPGAYAFEWTGPNGFSANTEDIESLEAGCFSLTMTHLETNCSIDTIICVQDLTSVFGPLNTENYISFFPNPANSSITIVFNDEMAGEFLIMVIDPEGRTIFKKCNELTEYQTTINVSSLNPGIYSLVIEGQKFQVKRKFIKI